ncbi:MAG: MBL fold metallo-hydrolase [Peptococcaceae bacterium]|nr:MBL fold metallo-hydrolase [Peptococcaceae bacterium]
MDFLSLASGSKGNCYYLAAESGALLVDCGISLKRLEAAVAAQAGSMDAIGGILITHEHRDHISGLGPLLRRYAIPCYATAATLDALTEKLIGRVDRNLFHAIDDGPLSLGDFDIHWSRTSHDAADPVSYQIRYEDMKVGMLTDAGVASDDNREALYDSNVLLVEANHDLEMLRNGPYPALLKRRIASDHGHLSNDSCAQMLTDVIGPHTEHVVLGHLSEKNNLPACAYQTVYDHLQEQPPAVRRLRLWVAGQKLPLALSLHA